VVPVNAKDEKMLSMAENIYQQLLAAGVEAVLDDRLERPGVKFKDADLIGYPVRVVIGKKAVENDEVEVHQRSNQQTTHVSYNDVLDTVRKILFVDK